MKPNTRRVLIILSAVFALLFLTRFAYELLRAQPSADSGNWQAAGNFNLANQEVSQDVSSYRSVKNIASSKIVIKQAAAADQVIDQKYERVADLSAHSNEFDNDRQKLDSIGKELDAVVQQETSGGLKGARRLALTLGVVPASFENLVAKLQTIGKIDSITVNKTDKTGEYKALAAKRLSLEKTRDGLRALKVPGAALADLIQLETRILEIEGQIQDLGVSLGDFAETNSFCTVQFSLSESRPAVGPNLLRVLIDTISWTLPVYLGLLLAAALALLTAILTGILIDKIHVWTGNPGKAPGAKEGQSSKPE